MNLDSQLHSWRAIEALRAGVPNRAAVQALGSSQPQIEERFRKLLATVEEGISEEAEHEGILIGGDFGTGKSHLLEYLQHVALQSNFICSKVVISKETPLYDPAKVYSAAIQSAKVPDRAGAALPAIAGKLNFNSPQYARFYQWVNRPNSGFSTRFPATVFVYERGGVKNHPEIADRIIQFWEGGKLPVGEFRNWLRELGEASTYKVDRVSPKELTLQRFRFIPQLIAAAGYSGWIILIDEVELIARYSLQQRAKSYAEVARLLGSLDGSSIPGLGTVLAITLGYEGEVLDQRYDEEKIPNRLRANEKSDTILQASQAEKGMRKIRQIRRDHMDLARVTDTREIYEKTQAVYAQAYDGWDPPQAYQANNTWSIRQHIKRWINQWDLNRLYPDYIPQIEIAELRQDYSEMPDLEAPPEEDAPEGDAGA